MLPCPSAKFADRHTVVAMKNKIMRRSGVITRPRYCEQCDAFHLVAVVNQHGFKNRQVEIIRLTAQGLTTLDIARELKVHICTVEYHLRAIRERLSASSLPNMVAIAIALNFIDPREFLPDITEQKHA